MVVQEFQTRQLLNRLKTVAGHIRGVQRMVEAHAYCIDIIKQTQAVMRALDRVNSLLLEEYLNHDVTAVLRDGQQNERERVVHELLTVFRRTYDSEADLPAAGDAEERIPQRLAWLARIEEQVQAIQRMLEKADYPAVIMTEVRNVHAMLDAFQSRVLVDHLNSCVTTAIRSQRPEERERVVDELLQVFTSGGKL